MAVAGELDTVAADGVREELVELVGDNPRLLVDLSELTFVNARGLAALEAAARAASERRGWMRVCNPSARQRWLLEITGLGSLLADVGEEHLVGDAVE